MQKDRGFLPVTLNGPLWFDCAARQFRWSR